MYTSQDYPICAELKNKYSANRGWLSDRSLKADEQSIMGSGAISKEYTIKFVDKINTIIIICMRYNCALFCLHRIYQVFFHHEVSSERNCNRNFEANLWLKSVDYCKVCIYKYPSLVDHKLDTKNYPPITIPPYPLLHSHTVHNSSTLPKESVESTPIIQYWVFKDHIDHS